MFGSDTFQIGRSATANKQNFILGPILHVLYKHKYNKNVWTKSSLSVLKYVNTMTFYLYYDVIKTVI
jgi:hypothetical protein